MPLSLGLADLQSQPGPEMHGSAQIRTKWDLSALNLEKFHGQKDTPDQACRPFLIPAQLVDLDLRILSGFSVDIQRIIT
jgi:hypothetical protein